ncbi:hypothetical protein [Tersicoccus sp. Bi-70]|uniref:hypothetical protein n=1 Tax=Tersicoccus sp. Bi-70 TaxID=1897634 RepID=UPI00097660B4|nr:hypothetical protein [Tersicoccus sp. Bi-70]OMH34817.1 hypothetical protein BGP79_00075 [Tersicoccus sp. Bi-70]
MQESYLRAVDELRDAVSPLLPDHDDQQVLATVALLVGALQLSRANAGTPESDAILAAARAALRENPADS